MDKVIPAIIGSLSTSLLLFIGAMIYKLIKRNVHVQSPESIVIDKLIPAVNQLMDSQLAQMGALIVLLETTKGQCNGNVDSALKLMKDAQIQYHEFLKSSAQIKAVV